MKLFILFISISGIFYVADAQSIDVYSDSLLMIDANDQRRARLSITPENNIAFFTYLASGKIGGIFGNSETKGGTVNLYYLNGKRHVSLSANDTGGSLFLLDNNEQERTALRFYDDGNKVSLRTRSSAGQIGSDIGTDNSGGYMNLYNKTGFSNIILGTSEDQLNSFITTGILEDNNGTKIGTGTQGGYFEIYDQMGQTRANLSIFSNRKKVSLDTRSSTGKMGSEIGTDELGGGGYLDLYDVFENRRISMNSESNTSTLEFLSQAGITGLTLNTDNDTGGRFDLFDKAENRRISMSTLSDATSTDIDTYTASGIIGSTLGSKNSRGGFMELFYHTGTPLLDINTDLSNDHGNMNLYNNIGKQRVALWSSSLGSFGGFEVFGKNDKRNILASATGSNLDLGYLGIYNGTPSIKVGLHATDEGHGTIKLWGANGNENIFITGRTDHSNHGYMHVANTTGVGRAGAFINNDEKGVIFGDRMKLIDASGNTISGWEVNGAGDVELNVHTLSASVKNFKMDHPTRPNKEIWYASVEGPEAAAYIRGTATLKNGLAQIDLPEHFSTIIESEGITVHITPLSASSKGIAVTAKHVDHFKVQELLEGQGSYDFDWEIKAIRKGYKDYEVVRDKPKEDQNKKSNDSFRKNLFRSDQKYEQIKR